MKLMHRLLGLRGGEMKKRSILLTIVTIIVVIAITTTTIVIIDNKKKSAEAEEKNRIESETKSGIAIEFSYYEDYWKKYDLTNAVYKTQSEYEDAVRTYMNQITILLNKQDWYQEFTGIDTIYIGLKIYDVDDAIGQQGILLSKNNNKTAMTCDLYMSNSMFKHNSSPLVNMLTRLIITKKEGDWLSSLGVGFCNYVQNNLGVGIGSLNYGLDIHNYLIEFTKKQVEATIKDSTMSEIRDNVGEISLNHIYPATPKGHLSNDYWTLCNYSFVDYLVNTYGFESVMKLIDGYDDSIYYLLNQNGLSGLVSDWKQFLENYPCKMTGDEIDAQIAQIKSAHGY